MRATTYMRRCLELAEVAALAGETAVGALIVCGGEIVGEGVERTRATRDPSAHAEVEAIRHACQHLDTLDLRGCSLYSTVEPCVLCGYAIRRTGIASVVYGVPGDRPARARPPMPSLSTLTLKDGRRSPRSPVACLPTSASRLCGERRTSAKGHRACRADLSLYGF